MSEFSAQIVSLPSQQNYADSVFPLLYKGCPIDDDAVLHWVEKNKVKIENELKTHGAILFRDMGVNDDQGFDRFIRAFDWPSFTYEESLSNAVRRNRTELVFTANEAPPDVSIFLHHEMAQTPIYPSKLFFFCELAPQSGGFYANLSV